MGTVSIGAGVSIVGSGGSNIDFTTVVPFSRSGSMGTYFVSGPVEFTPSSAGAVAGASVFARVVADGTNVPTFSGIEEWGTSFGFDNSQAGVLNRVDFWYDGVSYYYAISQPLIAEIITGPDVTSPILQSAVINGSDWVLTYNENLIGSISASSLSFSGAGGITQNAATAGISGMTIVGTLTTPAANGDAVTLTASLASVTDNAANAVANVTDLAVTNVTSSSATAVTFTTVGGVTETPNDPFTGQYTYTSSGGISTFGTDMGVGNISIPASSDGTIYYTITDGTLNGLHAKTIIGLLGGASKPAAATYTTWVGGVNISPVNGKYYRTVGAAATDTTVTAQTGDTVRIQRVSGTITAHVARSASPNTWVSLGTIAASGSTLRMWPMLDFGAASKKLVNLRGVGLS